MIFKSSYLILFTLLAPLVLAIVCPGGARVRREDESGEKESELGTEPPAEATEPPVPGGTLEGKTESKDGEPGEGEKEGEKAGEAAEKAAKTVTTEPPKESGGSDAIFPGVDRTELTTPIKWVKEAIEVHNNFRALHDSQPLVFNKTIADISQSWANYLAKTGKKPPDHNPKRGALGENLYYSSASIVLDVNASTPVTGWYNEIHDYDFKTADTKDPNAKPFPKPVLHFTQLVWKETKEMGIAYATTSKPINGMYTTYVVANYYPTGNFGDVGVFNANVVPVIEKHEDKIPKPKPTDAPGKPKTPTTKPGKENPNSGFRSYESLSLFLGCTVALFFMF